MSTTATPLFRSHHSYPLSPPTCTSSQAHRPLSTTRLVYFHSLIAPEASHPAQPEHAFPIAPPLPSAAARLESTIPTLPTILRRHPHTCEIDLPSTPPRAALAALLAAWGRPCDSGPLRRMKWEDGCLQQLGLQGSGWRPEEAQPDDRPRSGRGFQETAARVQDPVARYTRRPICAVAMNMY